ncbi:hypothetical protein QBC99_004605 [Beijerinckia sp. GAS462]|nr:hypothetical protein [Beijerinckia sp. GAS462]SED24358.1 hypothetical protein SAMN05443249_4841 [Beijerinckia sp. 28-YEA-48]
MHLYYYFLRILTIKIVSDNHIYETRCLACDTFVREGLPQQRLDTGSGIGRSEAYVCTGT